VSFVVDACVYLDNVFLDRGDDWKDFVDPRDIDPGVVAEDVPTEVTFEKATRMRDDLCEALWAAYHAQSMLFLFSWTWDPLLCVCVCCVFLVFLHCSFMRGDWGRHRGRCGGLRGEGVGTEVQDTAGGRGHCRPGDDGGGGGGADKILGLPNAWGLLKRVACAGVGGGKPLARGGGRWSGARRTPRPPPTGPISGRRGR